MEGHNSCLKLLLPFSRCMCFYIKICFFVFQNVLGYLLVCWKALEVVYSHCAILCILSLLYDKKGNQC